MEANYRLFDKTPEVSVIDNRGHIVREIRYHRHPDTPEITDTCITRHQFSIRGHLVQAIDPRLFELKQKDATIKPNFHYDTSLNGEVIAVESNDAGSSWMLSDVAGRPMLNINAKGMIRTYQYEEANQLGRLLYLEEEYNQSYKIVERLIWSGNSQTEKDNNLAGHCVRHYNTAGMTEIQGMSLTDTPLAVNQRLIKTDVTVNWQGNNESIWEELLNDQIFITSGETDAVGAIIKQVDAKGNSQRHVYDVAGMLCKTLVTVSGGSEQILVKDIRYSATGQKLEEEYGNGIIAKYSYELESQRLIRNTLERPIGHSAGAKILQDFYYDYDRVGNLIKIENRAETVRFWRNQQIDVGNEYVYDSLYQLVLASGREMANIGQPKDKLPEPIIPLIIDNNTYSNYTRNYTYDRGGNLTQIRHSDPAISNNYTLQMTLSSRNNQGVVNTLTTNPKYVPDFFDVAGNLLKHNNKILLWTERNQLNQVIINDDDLPFMERYIYDTNGQRIIKINTQQVSSYIQTRETYYLPGLEIRTKYADETLKENLQVLYLESIGQAQVQLLHWEVGQPEGISNNQIRYSFTSPSGSTHLEFDQKGSLITQEEYYPYGGTAVWSAHKQLEVNFKTIRYSGKERDCTGFYYYGERYYLPNEGRWSSPDPSGTKSGLNDYQFVQNNPISNIDPDGQASQSRYQNIFWLSTFLARFSGKDAASSFAQGIKITQMIRWGLLAAGIAISIVATAGVGLVGLLIAGAVGFAVGAIVGWKMDNITKYLSKMMGKFAQGRSAAFNIAAGASVAYVTALSFGTSNIGTLIATTLGGFVFGGLGYLFNSSERGLAGAHAASSAVGITEILQGRTTSIAQRVNAGFAAGVGGLLVPSQSGEIARNAAIGSVIGGNFGRRIDNFELYVYRRLGGRVINTAVNAIATTALSYFAGDNVFTRFINNYITHRALGLGVRIFVNRLNNLRSNTGGPSEWTGSAAGAAVGALGTVARYTSDPHFNRRAVQVGGLLNTLMGFSLDLWGVTSGIVHHGGNLLWDLLRSGGQRAIRGGVF